MKYPIAQWKGANPNNFSSGKNTPRFVVIHVAQGSNQGGTDSWFQNPHAVVSAHFSIGKDGQVHQYVDTDQIAYAEMAWNDKAISIEHNGLSGEHLTAQQLASLEALLKWISDKYRIPLVWVNDGHGMYGVTGHGNLGVDGGNHPQCPGTGIVADVKAMLSHLQGQPASPAPVKRARLHVGSTGLDVIYLQHKLHVPSDGIFGQQTLASVKHFQTINNLEVTGVVDDKTWAKLERP